MKRRVVETSDKTTIVKSERKCRAAVGNSRLLASLVRLYLGIVIGSWGIKVGRTRQQMFAEVTSAETKLTKPAWYQATAKYAQSNPGRSSILLFLTSGYGRRWFIRFKRNCLIGLL
jgi:hypothetical protein